MSSQEQTLFVVSHVQETKVSSDGYDAGRATYEKVEQVEPYLVPAGELPTEAEFAAYFQLYQPGSLTAEDVEWWRRFFMFGWYSCVLLVDY